MSLKYKNKIEDIFSLKIESKRINLLVLCEKYIEDIFHNFTDEITYYMVPSTPTDIRETLEFVENAIKTIENKRNLIFTILDKEDNFLGMCGLHNNEELEIGIWLKKEAHGNKYGLESIKAMKEWIDNNIDYKYMIYPVAVDNIASNNIPIKLGAKFHKETNFIAGNGTKFKENIYRLYPSSETTK